ncbi:MAG: acetyl ornithine aminotransferase family protein [Candidatus Alcyoniella australis]|nr:acetyl ornithine aminotransferase family protein [Candidatus Alcyoniella australis]
MKSLTYPKLKTRLPGPEAKRLLNLDRRYISRSYTRTYPLVADHGVGNKVVDVDGNQFLDFTSGIAVTASGHCHPRVVAAIREQAGKLLHMSGTDFYYVPQIELARELSSIAPIKGRKTVYFGNSGAEGVEAAFKLARHHTGRQRVIAFLGAFHGRTMGALSLTASKSTQRQGFGSLVPGVVHVPFAYCHRCPYNMRHPECDLHCADYIEQTIFNTIAPADEVAAIFVEPIQGEGGYIVPPPGYLKRLREICDRHGIMLVADEIQTGMGRTGKMFAVEHSKVKPDILVCAKGLASGLPISAIVAPESVMDWGPGAHASTFGGNPLSCAAALETIALLRGGLIENARVQGERLTKGLNSLAADSPRISDVRGLGLMVGAEIVDLEEQPDPQLRDKLIQDCFKRGLLLLPCGDNVVRFVPGLVVTPDEIDKALEIFEQTLNLPSNRGRK